ncbi:MAG: HEAT repeat domain-containing protein [Asgard group archaeon]|nr:HEAT repeat domain-containing protein [Asgard group archaeon]
MVPRYENNSPIKEDLEPLIETLETADDWNLRFGAASKLFRLGQERAIDPLINAIQNDPHPEVRRLACDLLGRLGNPRASWALIAALRKALMNHDSTMIYHTTAALLNIDDDDLVDILLSTISDEQEFIEMRYKAIDLLGKIRNNESIEGLIALIKNPNTDGRIRSRAIRKLIRTGNLAGLQLILDFLEKTDNITFEKVVVSAMGKTPFKNQTIILRVGDSLLSILEREEGKGEKKNHELTNLVVHTMTKLAKNIGLAFKEYIDKILEIRKKQKT